MFVILTFFHFQTFQNQPFPNHEILEDSITWSFFGRAFITSSPVKLDFNRQQILFFSETSFQSICCIAFEMYTDDNHKYKVMTCQEVNWLYTSEVKNSNAQAITPLQKTKAW